MAPAVGTAEIEECCEEERHGVGERQVLRDPEPRCQLERRLERAAGGEAKQHELIVTTATT